MLEGFEEMKILVAYYSRHGHTGIVGKKIARKLWADVEEIRDVKDRSNLQTWFQGAFNEELRTPTRIEETRYNPGAYDLVVIGTPIWDGISPPVRAYLKNNKFKKVAFFATFGAAAEDAFHDMKKLSGKKPVAVLGVQDRQIDLGEHKNLIKEFCSEIILFRQVLYLLEDL
jgi:flavodoxin